MYNRNFNNYNFRLNNIKDFDNFIFSLMKNPHQNLKNINIDFTANFITDISNFSNFFYKNT